MPGNKGKGLVRQWLVDHAQNHGDECLRWPFCKTRGYGIFGYMGKRYYAHRYMCELVNGPPPSPQHQAAHSCGQGSYGCVHPQHLSWKTRTENQLDCRQHGTHAKSTHGRGGKLTDDQVAEIRSLQGIEPQCDMATRFGVTETTISNICTGRTRFAVPKKPVWRPDEDAILREGHADKWGTRKLAQVIGRSQGSVTARIWRLGIARPENSSQGRQGESQ